MEGITWWDSSDGGWLNAPADLLRKDGSTKPAYEELVKLIRGEWWIPPTKLTTDEKGKIRFTGILGEHKFTHDRQQKIFTVTKVRNPVENLKT